MNSILVLLSMMLGAIVAQQNLKFGYDCKGFQSYNFYDNGRQFDIGYNIGLKTKTSTLYVLQENNIGIRPRCFNVSIGTQTYTYASEVVFPYVDSDGTIINVVAPLQNTVTVSTAETAILDVVSLMQAPGFRGYTWVDRPDGQKDIILNTPLTELPAAYNVVNGACPTGGIKADVNAKRMNCIHGGSVVDDYFLNDVSYTWALWLLVILMLAYFFSLLCFEDSIALDYAGPSVWTLHPAVSIWTRGSEIYTKQSRLALYCFFIASLAFFTALMHLRWYDQSLPVRLIVLPIFGTFFALITTAIMGYLLTRYYAIHWEFINGFKAAENHDMKKINLDNYERRAFKVNYIFYVLLIILMAHFLIWPIYIFYQAPLDLQGYWMAGIGIGVAIDLLIWRMIMVALGRSMLFLRMFKVYGFWYDQKMHEEYSNIVGYKM